MTSIEAGLIFAELRSGAGFGSVGWNVFCLPNKKSRYGYMIGGRSKLLINNRQWDFFMK